MEQSKDTQILENSTITNPSPSGPYSSDDFLVCQSMNQVMDEAKKLPIPKMLFSEFWYEGELCILFSTTGQGKSILAFQIGDSISKGKAIKGFKLEAEKQPVLYFDFELSEKQLERRYSEQLNKGHSNHYDWDNDFKRVSIDPNKISLDEKESYEKQLIKQIEKGIVNTKSSVVIIDNLTCIRSDVEKARDANPFMQKLIRLKRKQKLSLLVLAHTPKRNQSNPLTINDLQGSSALAQFADSIFAIGRSSKDNNLRYIKQLKERFSENLYGSDNVIVCEIDKPANFLQFSFLEFEKEADHLLVPGEREEQNRDSQIMYLHNSGLSYRAIAEKVGGISQTTVMRVVKKVEKQKPF